MQNICLNNNGNHSNTEEEWPLELTKGGAVVRVFRRQSKRGYVSYTIAYYQHGERKREVLSDEAEVRKRARIVRDSLADGEVDGPG